MTDPTTVLLDFLPIVSFLQLRVRFIPAPCGDFAEFLVGLRRLNYLGVGVYASPLQMLNVLTQIARRCKVLPTKP